MVERLFFAVPWGCLWFVIVVFPDHTHYFQNGTTSRSCQRAVSGNKAKVVKTLCYTKWMTLSQTEAVVSITAIYFSDTLD